jgi:hypothetical protein
LCCSTSSCRSIFLVQYKRSGKLSQVCQGRPPEPIVREIAPNRDPHSCFALKLLDRFELEVFRGDPRLGRNGKNEDIDVHGSGGSLARPSPDLDAVPLHGANLQLRWLRFQCASLTLCGRFWGIHSARSVPRRHAPLRVKRGSAVGKWLERNTTTQGGCAAMLQSCCVELPMVSKSR